MKFLPSQLAYLLGRGETRQNLKALAEYLTLLAAIIVLFATLFHVIMIRVEGQEHSWLTGLYWTLTVMTTLGFGDITFASDIGRAFSILVLLTGLVMLLIMLPFTFIRFFYAPWLEAQIRVRAPRELPPDHRDHVILCHHDEVAEALISRLDLHGIPHVTLEPDRTRAAGLVSDGIPVLAGDVEDVRTFRGARAEAARLVLANSSDAANCNITLTAKEAAPRVPIVALVDDEDAMDVIQLAGADHVLMMKERLGEHLAGRVAVGAVRAQEVGRYGPLCIAELPLHGTPLAGRTLRETRLRVLTGVNVVALWERGQLHPARPDVPLAEHAVAVVVGDETRIESLNRMLESVRHNDNPVLVIGGGRVGCAAIRALKRRGIAVTVIEREPGLEGRLSALADRVVIGDAAALSVIERGGIHGTPSVVLTANDDAVNIFLAVYCRKLNPDVRIVSRITRERNLESIHRAGADVVLSYTTLTAGYLMSILLGREMVVLGEGVDVVSVSTPPALAGRTLGESGIGAQTGMSVIGIVRDGQVETDLDAKTELVPGTDLVMIGTREQHEEFQRHYASGRKVGTSQALPHSGSS